MRLICILYLVHYYFFTENVHQFRLTVYSSTFHQIRGLVKGKTFLGKNFKHHAWSVANCIIEIEFPQSDYFSSKNFVLRKTVNLDTKNQYYNHFIFHHLSILHFMWRNNLSLNVFYLVFCSVFISLSGHSYLSVLQFIKPTHRNVLAELKEISPIFPWRCSWSLIMNVVLEVQSLTFIETWRLATFPCP